MALKESLSDIKEKKEKMRSEVEETRELVKSMRPRPLRRAVNRKMSDFRPLGRIRQLLARKEDSS